MQPLKQHSVFLLTLCLLLYSSISAVTKRYNKLKIMTSNILSPSTTKATIFIHGTLPFGTAYLVRMLESPLGLIPANTLKNRFILSRIGYLLQEAAPQQFPLESTYLYGWSGKLCFQERLKAAQELYKDIQHFKGSLTIIAHSHGCNVALSLAQVAAQHNNTTLQVDKLILLGCPVQAATVSWITSPLFKRVFSFYSTADLLQISDPQGLYKASAAYRKPGKKLPLFSGRTFPAAHNLIQTRILINGQNPGHIDFILGKFLKKLPSILDLLDKEPRNSHNRSVVNIPLKRAPHLVNMAQRHKR